MSDTPAAPYLVQSPNGPHRFPDFASADQWARERAVIWPGADVRLTGPDGSTTYYLPSYADAERIMLAELAEQNRCAVCGDPSGVRCCEFGSDR